MFKNNYSLFLGSFSAFRSQSFVRRPSSQKDFHSSRAANLNSFKIEQSFITDTYQRNNSHKNFLETKVATLKVHRFKLFLKPINPIFVRSSLPLIVAKLSRFKSL